ncbi:unnamed protein product [Rangifer tarandus platyrhynchus]|uniref:Uncharacterized protein n=2 Tax=Rangifer tarandus platyrhynchus TaxID=3082113 RepID=A0ACB0F3U5_RANTA|nr:unnamed protein product [Rangifer tarandus platyrhynchus]CAI9706979.1 unnamed protein product [Rangifer tarandus platyrhynchus]
MAADCEAAARLLARSLAPSLPGSLVARSLAGASEPLSRRSPPSSSRLPAPPPAAAPASTRLLLTPPPPPPPQPAAAPQPAKHLSPRSAPCRAAGDPRSPPASGPEEGVLGPRERGVGLA